jgi:hypothetical protein
MSVEGRVGRRGVLGLLMGLSGLAQNRLRGGTVGSPLYDRLGQECSQLAVSAMRFLNTAEAWHKRRTGQYADWLDLIKSPEVDRMSKEEMTEKMGIGRSLLARMSFRQEELIPGWRLQFRLTRPSSERPDPGYLAGLSRVDVMAQRFTFASDEIGVVYGGPMADTVRLSTSEVRAATDLPWVECKPLETHPESPDATVVFSFGGRTADMDE